MRGSKSAAVAFFSFLIFVGSIAEGQTAGQIPQGKVLTPGGRLVDAACAYEVPNGASITAQGDVVLSGATIAHHAPCTPTQMGLDPSSPPTGWRSDTWADAATFSGVAVFQEMVPIWHVPNNPSTNGALLYYFPSFQSATYDITKTEIVQPVLQWGNNGMFGGNYWSLASWYCGPSQCPHSTPTTTSSSDELIGQVYNAGGNVWNIFVEDNKTGNYSWLFSPTTIYPFDTVQGGVLELYNLTTCSQLPSNGDTVFWDKIYQDNGSGGQVQVFPAWSTQIGVLQNPSPNCSYNGYGFTSSPYSISAVYY